MYTHFLSTFLYMPLFIIYYVVTSKMPQEQSSRINGRLENMFHGCRKFFLSFSHGILCKSDLNFPIPNLLLSNVRAYILKEIQVVLFGFGR